MNVASLERCRELYELSGWGLMSNGTSTEYYYQKRYVPGDDFQWRLDAWCDIANNGAGLNIKVEKGNAIPAYDLGYLLRQLPEGTRLWRNKSKPKKGSNGGLVWSIAAYRDWQPFDGKPMAVAPTQKADTPENAAAKLCITLIKQGILTSEGIGV